MSVPSAHWSIADRVTESRLNTDLIGTETFSSFSKPRLAVGPSGNHALAQTAGAGMH